MKLVRVNIVKLYLIEYPFRDIRNEGRNKILTTTKWCSSNNSISYV